MNPLYFKIILFNLNRTKLTKKVPKRHYIPSKNEVLHDFFFTQKDHPASPKTEILHEQMKKK